MRQRIFEVIEVGAESDKASRAYDTFMMITIFVSIVPLAIKHHTQPLIIIERIATAIFLLDYILRWITADLKRKNEKHPFAKYPIGIMALLDIVSILPSIIPITGTLRLLRIIRLARTLRVFRVIRYSKSVQTLLNVLRKQKDALSMVIILTLGYIAISALVIFNVEPLHFENFFEALYWATISITSVGYGDIVPLTGMGRLVAMVSSLVGIAIIALPSSIITAGYIDELKSKNEDKNSDEKENE